MRCAEQWCQKKPNIFFKSIFGRLIDFRILQQNLTEKDKKMIRSNFRKLPLYEKLQLIDILDLLTVEQASIYLQCSDKTIRRMLDKGELTNVSKSGILIRKTDLLKHNNQ